MEVFWAIRADGIRARSDMEVLDWLVTKGRGKANSVVVQASGRAVERTSERAVEQLSSRAYEQSSG
jgi:hypothetical protein